MKSFVRGDRVISAYWHCIYPGRPFQRTKIGEFIRLIHHRPGYWRKLGAEQLAYVSFEGNYNASRVPLHELKSV